MTTQTQTTEERLSKLEGAYGQVNERFNDLTLAVREGDAALREGDAALREADAALRTDMNERFNELARGQDALRASLDALHAEMHAEIGKLRSEMHRQTYLIIGVIGGLVTLLRFIG